MDIALVIIGFLLMIIGILGSLLPVLPGPPLSWIGLLLLYMTNAVPNNWVVIVVTLIVAILIVVLDYVIPAFGTKKFGGSNYGMIGTSIGLIMSFFIPIFGLFGIIIWPFIGALVGELIHNSNSSKAMKAAFGSFIGFLVGTFLKFLVAVIYLGIFIKVFWDYKHLIF